MYISLRARINLPDWSVDVQGQQPKVEFNELTCTKTASNLVVLINDNNILDRRRSEHSV